VSRSRKTTLSDDISRRTDHGLEVRRATERDLPGILLLLSQMHDDEPPLQRTDELNEIFAEILRCFERAILVAVRDDAVLGTLDLFVVANLTRGGRPWAGVENVVVDEAHRGQGIGRLLLDVAVDAARSSGCYKLQLVSHTKRDAAHALYRSAGFDAPVSGYRRYLDM
jgi:GNAT superfamily N-acetyltransferase